MSEPVEGVDHDISKMLECLGIGEDNPAVVVIKAPPIKQYFLKLFAERLEVHEQSGVLSYYLWRGKHYVAGWKPAR